MIISDNYNAVSNLLLMNVLQKTYQMKNHTFARNIKLNYKKLFIYPGWANFSVLDCIFIKSHS